MDLRLTPISEAPDVNITGRVTGQMLSWNSATGKYDHVTVNTAAETLAQTLVAGQTTGPTDIILSNAGFGVGSVAGDYLYMNGGTIELVTDYNGAYASGVYADTGSGYSVLFFDGWGGAFEGYANSVGDPRGSVANIYTSGEGVQGRIIFSMSDNSDPLKGLSSPSILFADVTIGNLLQSAPAATELKKASLIMTNNCFIEENTILCSILHSKDCSIETNSSYCSIIASTGVIISPLTSVTNSAIIASNATAWANIESNTLYSDNHQLAGHLLLRTGAIHSLMGDAAQIYTKDIVAGNAAIHAVTELGHEIKLYKQVLTNTTGGTADGSLADVTTLGAADPAKINNNFAELWTILNNNGLVAAT